jgi:hypothetical protein
MSSKIQCVSYISMHNLAIDYSIVNPVQLVPTISSQEDEEIEYILQFGTLIVHIPDEIICTIPLLVMFTVDRSTSMSDKGPDGRSKWQYTIQSISNILQEFIASSSSEIYVCIYTFDSMIDKLIEPTLVSQNNIIELIAKLDSILPRNNTNMELALGEAKTTIATYRAAFPNHRIANINMTDGVITEGKAYYVDLVKYLSADEFTIFVGYGLDHNSTLLHQFAETCKGEYRFIDKLENIGLVFGEIIHGLLYPALSNIQITIEHGLIYDWNINTWTTQLDIPRISCGENKKYHVCTKTPYTVECKIVGIDINSGCQEVSLIETADVIPGLSKGENDNTYNNLIPYMFRQLTMELLYEAISIIKHKHVKNSKQMQGVKNKLKDLFGIIKEYIKTHELYEDIFLKVLLDDVFITLKATNSVKYGLMFINARHSSCCKQQYYNVTNIDALHLQSSSSHIGAPRRLSPGFSVNYQFSQPQYDDELIMIENDDDDDDDELPGKPRKLLQHQLSQSTDSVNTTPHAKIIMQHTSC